MPSQPQLAAPNESPAEELAPPELVISPVAVVIAAVTELIGDDPKASQALGDFVVAGRALITELTKPEMMPQLVRAFTEAALADAD